MFRRRPPQEKPVLAEVGWNLAFHLASEKRMLKIACKDVLLLAFCLSFKNSCWPFTCCRLSLKGPSQCDDPSLQGHITNLLQCDLEKGLVRQVEDSEYAPVFCSLQGSAQPQPDE